jgi:hypothetical protein
MNSARAIVTVNAPEAGTALIKARTTANIGWRPNAVDTVINVGDSSSPLPIPSNGEVCFWAEISFTSGNAATTPESCVTAAPNANVNVALAIQGGTLGLTATPDTNVSTFINVAPLRIKIQPSTAETNVNYVIDSGSLPTGVHLNTINSTTAIISGTPTQAGTFNFSIKGTDVDGNNATIAITYTVIDSVPPPVLSNRYIRILADSLPFTINYNQYNTGGAVNNWSLTFRFNLEQSPPPEWISINPTTGVLTITTPTGGVGLYGNYWSGFVRAENSTGFSEQQIQVQIESGNLIPR